MVDDQTKQRPIAVDLFAGAGGMTLGFEQAGFDVLCSVEFDPIHCATHEYNFPFWSVICKSLTEVTGKEIRDNSAIGDRDIDVVFGGPPCQGFSIIGKRILDDSRNFLVFHFIRVVLELQPKYVVIENVAGMATKDFKQLLWAVIEDLKLHGYAVEEKYQILNAAYYGIPQKRKRLFLLGCREGLKLPNYPVPITKPANSKNSRTTHQLPSSPTIWEALKDLPIVEFHPELYERDWAIAEFGKPSDYGKKLRGFCIVEDDYSYKRQHDARILTSSIRTKHTLEIIRRFESTLPGEIERISRFPRLHPNGVCNTLRAGTASNRGAFTSPRPIHPFIPRCITIREAARLHSYPDWFRFHSTKWHGFRQVGNSVPPLLAKAIALEVMNVLGIKPSKPEMVQELGEEKLLQFTMSDAAKYYGVNPKIIEEVTSASGQKSLTT